MRKWLGALLLTCLLLPAWACAEMDIVLEKDRVVIGEWIYADVTGAEGMEYTYSAYMGEKQLFEGLPTTVSGGYYLPPEVGEYVLRVTARDTEGNETVAEKPFRVVDPPVCTITTYPESVKTGEALDIAVEAVAGTGGYAYTYAIVANNQRIYRKESTEPAFTYIPAAAGDVTVEVTVTDDCGNTGTAQVTIPVAMGDGVSVAGETGAFFAPGGLHRWTVNAPGVWQAATDAAFIDLYHDCGMNGDALVIGVDANTGAAREGVVTITCGEYVTELTVFQSDETGVESEVYMEYTQDAIFVDGVSRASWLYAEGARTFDVTASGPWQVSCDADFVTLSQENGLCVTLDDNETDAVREAVVVLACGKAQAYLHICQPSADRGADVRSVTLSADQGVAYRDMISALVVTSADAEKVTVTADGWREAIVLTQPQTRESGGGLLWSVDIPLTGSGEQVLLFSAENELGSDARKTAVVAVTGEEAAFAEPYATLDTAEEQQTLTVKVTSATERLELADAAGNLLGAYTPGQAFVDKCLADDAAGRYARWIITLPLDIVPAEVRMGENAVPVWVEEKDEEEMILYSQQDTLWDDVKYRHSDLQTSGCAIFALSHVLQLLGFEGEEILPANLADEYAFCLVEGGTLNATLVGNAGKDLGFKTRYELYENLPEIVEKTRQGAMWSFMVAKGHIAAVVGVSEDGKMFRIVDSAPSATFERTEKGTMYWLNEQGEYVPILDLADVPGARYYLESSGYNGMEYYMTAEYVANQGVRLIMPE